VIRWGRKRWPDSKHFAVGFSLSGNALLLLLGSRHDLSDGHPDAAVSVNAPIDLARTSQLLERGLNRIYSRKFVKDCRRDIASRVRAGLLQDPPAIPRGAKLWDIDDLFTAPMGGFKDRHDYYARASAGPHLSKIRIPAVMLTAEDDPFVDVHPYRDLPRAENVGLHIERAGGHMGYLGAKLTPLGNRFWMDWALREYALKLISTCS
jgi:predicted alpha/beta-fold hydrolase